MPFENEFASYEPLRRILDSEKVQVLQKRLKVRKTEDSNQQLSDIVGKNQLEPSHWQPDWVLAIDGSYHAVKAENGFPGAEFGYVTLASVLIFLDKIREMEKQEFIDPRKFRETEKASTIESVYPGCNVMVDDEDSAKSSMRKMLFEELKTHVIFSEGETLLDTYEVLLKIKREKSADVKSPRCPCELEQDFEYGYGQYPCSKCHKTLYSTDAMRLHELLNPGGTCGEMYGQIMFTLERLWLVHILRAFERKNWLPTLRRIAFIVDGSLAVYSTPSWLAKSISDELRRINELQKKTNGQDLIILGIEKTGNFVNHFEDLDTDTKGVKGKLPNQTAILLTDEYIKKNIIFSESPKLYGLDTYFGRKFFYKTQSGYRIVASLACYNDFQRDITTASPQQFSRLADVMNLLDQIVSSRFQNSVSPLVSAHAEASIPLNLGKRLFEDIAKEIRNRS
ncbi:MAG: nuclease [Thiotrichaceae bacterium IS1]|nr:MAG: nuclease [Thiotrichaceae bacterium IS1]